MVQELQADTVNNPTVTPTDVDRVSSLESGLSHLTGTETTYDVVLLDLNLPDSAGLETLDSVTEVDSSVAIVVLTGVGDQQLGREAVDKGAQDFLIKAQVTPRVLDKAISYAQTRKAQTDAIQQQRNELRVLNWVIRHEIRNDAAIILGWANELMPDSASERRSLNRIEDASDHIVKLTKSVGGLVNTLQDDKAELNAIEMTSVLEAEATRLQETHDSVTITVADGSPESVSVRANEFLGTVFRNVLSSAIERNAADGQQIEISVQPPTRTESESTIDPVSTDGGDSDTYVWVSVKDDREVIDHLTSESLTTTSDTREADETHIGLYFVNKFMTQYGGEVRLEDDAPDGKIIRLGFVPA